MKTLLQQVLEVCPNVSTYPDLGIKIDGLIDTIVAELQRQRAAKGDRPLRASFADDDLFERVKATGDAQLAEDVRSAITDAALLESHAGFAAGYFAAKRPEVLIFHNED